MNPSLSWTVKLSAVLQKKSFRFHKLFGFPAPFNPFQRWLYDFEIHLFTRGQLRDSYATITEGSNAHWCFQKENHASRARAWKLVNRMKMCTFFLFCLNIQFYLFSTALQKLQKILTCFPKDKTNYIYPDLQFKKFLPLLIHGFSFWSIKRFKRSLMLHICNWSILQYVNSLILYHLRNESVIGRCIVPSTYCMSFRFFCLLQTYL